jgi:formylglycine-generating enzyme required for sulfatase activity
VNDVAKPATVSKFRLDRHEVTVGRFRAFVTAVLGGWRPTTGAGKHAHLAAGKGLSLPSNQFEAGWDSAWNPELALADLAAWTTELSCHPVLATWTSTAGANESRPVNCANWQQAYAFCIWDGGFLPSETEWNFAAAGGAEQRLYPWGASAPASDSSLAVHNCSYNGSSSCGGVGVIAPVGSVPAGNARWGHTDLAGNVAEWTIDGGGPTPCVDCAGASSGGVTVRGGYFGSTKASDLATTTAVSGARDLNNPSIGFRCARMP